MTAPPPQSSSVVASQFLLTALTWGMSFVFIKIALEGLSPVQVAFWRVTIGAAVLGVILLVTRKKLPTSWRTWLQLGVLAALMCVIPFVLMSTAQRHIAAGMASILNATTPLMTALIATIFLADDRLNTRKGVGLLCGILGVVVLMAPWQRGWQGDIIWQLMFLAATFCYGAAMVFLRKYVARKHLSSVVISFGETLLASVIIAAVAPLAAFASPHKLTWQIVASMLVLGAFGTGLAYVWHTNVLTAWGPTLASSVTYLVPLVGVVAGIALLGERPTWNEFVGGAIIVGGILIMQRIRLPRRRKTTPPTTPS